ncbi:hypothetical protein TNCV_2202601 [Trichonephila clavipes]|uniref:Uncharacterized protein n=1 Tax=Trichonephila clavipes TaxID=2585209 RepID=A0A8X6UZM3_TRICX|nr:hypothetical protein TNCV_2202601 [Trichonephila clavipes]
MHRSEHHTVQDVLAGCIKRLHSAPMNSNLGIDTDFRGAILDLATKESPCLRCRANPYLLRRSFEAFDKMLYHRMMLKPHMAHPIPTGTRYILLTVQKTMFGLDIIPETILPQLIEN